MDEKSEITAIKPKVNTTILDAFELLRKPECSAKTIGGAKIISFFRVQENQEKAHSSKYVLKRLIRSLGANVPDMRTGYFATLVPFLSNQEHVTISELLAIVKKELHANGSIKSEIGDIALGKILVCGAIFRSGLMLRGTPEEQKEVLHMLLSASTKKSYLCTTAYIILLDFVEKLSEEQFSTIVWCNIKPELKKDIRDHSLDTLYFLLITSKKFPSKVMLRKLIGVPELLCEDTIHAICEKIMGGIDLSSVSHPVYNAIGKEIADSPHLLLFWQSGIDSQLTSHKRNRELVAINLLTTILHNMEENHHLLPELITENFFKLFMDWFRGLQTASTVRTKRDDEEDHKIMIKKEKELLNALSKSMKSDKVDGKIRVAMLKKLLFSPGEVTFTETTGTNVVKPIISDLDKSGAKKMIKSFRDILLNTSKKFVKEGVERPWYNNERLKAAEYMSHLVNHESVKDDTEFRMTYMKILMCFGFFKIGGDGNVSMSAELADSIKTSFYRCFTSKFSTVDTLVDVLRSLCKFINEMIENEALKKKLEKQFPPENLECWHVLTEICDKIDGHESKSKIDKVFLILLYQLGLFLFSEPTHVKMARSSIKELKSCYEHYKKGKRKLNKSVNGKEDEEPEWIEVLLEVLLSILSTDNSVLRSIVQCVFTLLSEYLTPTCIEQIISVLDPDSESNPLSHESDSENESDNESDNESQKSDTANCDANSDSEKGSEDNTDDEDGDDDDDDEGDDLKTPEQLRMAVQKALGAAAPDSDTESIDADMIDEEEGKKLDEALAEAFKQFHQGKGKNSKKERKDKKALSDFRIRVLSLVDIYLEKDPSMDICLTIMAPLFRCLEFCLLDNQFAELANRLRKTIRNLTKIKKFSSTVNITMEDLCEYLRAVVDKGSKSHFMYQALGDVITFFATFVIHCSQKITPSKSKKSKTLLLDIFTNYLLSFFKDRSCLLPIIFFHNILQTDWDTKYNLIAVIIENVFNMEVRQYRRNEGLELLIGFYNSLKRIKPTSELATAKILELEQTLETTLKLALTGSEFAAKKNFVTSLKKLLNTIKSYHESCHTPTNLNMKELFEVVGSFKNIVKTEIVEKPVMTNGEKKRKKKKNKSNKQNGDQPKKKKRKLVEMNADE